MKDNMGQVHHSTGSQATKEEWCNSGHHFNQAMGSWADKMDQLEIFALAPPCECDSECDGPIRFPCHTTVYEEGDCKGASKLIRSDVVYRPKVSQKLSSPPT